MKIKNKINIFKSIILNYDHAINWMFSKDINYEFFETIRWDHNFIPSPNDIPSELYIYNLTLKYLKYIYISVYIYLKLKYPKYPITFKLIKKINYEKFSSRNGFYNFLINTSQIPKHCVSEWYQYT